MPIVGAALGTRSSRMGESTQDSTGNTVRAALVFSNIVDHFVRWRNAAVAEWQRDAGRGTLVVDVTDSVDRFNVAVLDVVNMWRSGNVGCVGVCGAHPEAWTSRPQEERLGRVSGPGIGDPIGAAVDRCRFVTSIARPPLLEGGRTGRRAFLRLSLVSGNGWLKAWEKRVMARLKQDVRPEGLPTEFSLRYNPGPTPRYVPPRRAGTPCTPTRSRYTSKLSVNDQRLA